MSASSLTGIHHVSAVTGRARENVRFYTRVLGLRFVCKSVNQDDPSSYHLFYGDADGSPGTDLTFFDVARARDLRPGTGLITGLSLRVRGRDALDAWAERLDAHGVRHTGVHERAGRAALTLFDGEGQTVHLVDDSADAARVPDTEPWDGGPVPVEQAVHGLGPVEATVADLGPTAEVLTDVLGFEESRAYTVEEDGSGDGPAPPSPPAGARAVVYETGPGGAGAELHLVERPDQPSGWLGTGGVHHVALRTDDSESIRAWRERIADAGLDVTPVIDRHYFESVYVREPGGILVEIATDTGASFPVEATGRGHLALPPSLEPNREQIEAGLEPLEVDSDAAPPSAKASS
jgi:glyoxalase family protein